MVENCRRNEQNCTAVSACHFQSGKYVNGLAIEGLILSTLTLIADSNIWWAQVGSSFTCMNRAVTRTHRLCILETVRTPGLFIVIKGYEIPAPSSPRKLCCLFCCLCEVPIQLSPVEPMSTQVAHVQFASSHLVAHLFLFPAKSPFHVLRMNLQDLPDWRSTPNPLTPQRP